MKQINYRMNPNEAQEHSCWSFRTGNNDKLNCDVCGTRLFVAPDGETVYCDATHTLAEVLAQQSKGVKVNVS